MKKNILYVVLRHKKNRVGDINNLAGVMRAIGEMETAIVDACAEETALPFETCAEFTLTKTGNINQSALRLSSWLHQIKKRKQVIFLTTGAKKLSLDFLRTIGGKDAFWIDLKSDVSFSWKQRGENQAPHLSFSLDKNQADSVHIPYLPSRWNDQFLENQYKLWAQHPGVTGGRSLAVMVGGTAIHRDLVDKFHARREIRSAADLVAFLKTGQAKESPFVLTTFMRTDECVASYLQESLKDRHPQDLFFNPRAQADGPNPLPGAFLHAAVLILPGESLSGLSDSIRIAEFRRNKGLPLPRVIISRPQGVTGLAENIQSYVLEIGLGSFDRHSLVLPPPELDKHIPVERTIFTAVLNRIEELRLSQQTTQDPSVPKGKPKVYNRRLTL